MGTTYQSVALILKRLKDSEGQAAVNTVEPHDVPQKAKSENQTVLFTE
jgi:hypothetical protein